MQTTDLPSKVLDPQILEQLRALGVTAVRFAYFEQHDEWMLEDITVAYTGGVLIEEPCSDALEPELCALLESISAEEGFFQIAVHYGTITRLDDAFALELRWWQLDEETQRALKASGSV
jgi:hypothetical protein